MRVIKEVFQDIDGNYSSKRAIAFFGFLLICVAFFSDLIYQRDVKEYILDAVVTITIASMGIAGTEFFSKSRGRSFTKNQNRYGTDPDDEDDRLARSERSQGVID